MSSCNDVWEVEKKQGKDPIFKCERVKNCRKNKVGDEHCLLYMEEELAIVFVFFYNSP